MRVLVLGGTTEGRELSVLLSHAAVPTTVCVATQAGAHVYPDDPAGPAVRVGRLDEDGLARLIGQGFDVVADATHPYAVEASRNARAACMRAGAEYLRVTRPPGDYTGCIVADDVEGAVRSVRRAGNVLATTGSKEIARFTALPHWQTRLFARVLDDPASVRSCREAGLDDSHILVGMGPFSQQSNVECIEANGIETLVTKDGGRAGGFYEKVAACRACGIDCVVVRRPQQERGLGVGEAFDYLSARRVTA